MSVNVSVIGGNSCRPETAALADELGELLALRGCTVFCGGMSGVMDAVARGVRRGGGVCVGILPTLDRRNAAPDLTLSVCTGIGHARNLAVVASGDVVIAVGGAWGTLSELGMARAIGREVVLLESWSVRPAARAATAGTGGAAPVDGEGEVDGLCRATSPAEAVDLALSLAGR
jgi:uncharacterized protein (TIGR00725 family)